MKKVFLALLTVLAVGTLAACSGDVDPEAISLSESSVEIEVGESVSVTATMEPSDAEQDVEWSSDDTGVAAVDDGEITGVAAGSATITATSSVDDSLSATVAVTVVDATDPVDEDVPESITLDKEDLELEVDDQVLITAEVSPEAAEQSVEWSSSNTEVATAAGGVLTAMGPGTATITATSTEDDSVSASITVTVIEASSSIADVIAMDDGTEAIFVIGVVTEITDHRTFYVEDATGAIAIYDGAEDYIADVSVGDRVRLAGERDTWNGLQQLTSLTELEVLASDADLPGVVNLSEEAVDLSDDAAMMPYQGHRVALDTFVVTGIDVDGFGNITVDLVGFESGYEIAFRYDSRLDLADDDMIFDLEEQDILDIDGMILGWHYGPQMSYAGDHAISYSDMGDESLDAYRVDSYISADFTIPWTESLADYRGETFTYESSDSSVATVDEGVITGLAEGATLITVKDEAGAVLSNIFVVVHPLEVVVNDALNEEGDLHVRTDEVFELDYSVLPEALVSQEVTIVSDDPDVVSVSQDDDDNWELTGVAEGNATLTITSVADPDADLELPVVVANSVPELDYIAQYQVYEGDAEFSILQDAIASDYMDDDDNLTITIDDDGGFDIDAVGTYTVEISVTNSYGETAEGTITIEVVEEGEVIAPSGEFNFQFVESDTRHTLFAAAERYLLQNVYGGVPNTINAGYALYSERTQLPVEDPVPVMNYGVVFGDFSEDDSSVIMDDGQYGEAGEYTWRGAETNDPGQYLQWEYDDSISADFLTLMLDSLYYFDFNETNTGYDVLPSMAEGMPTPEDAYENDFGVTLSKEWHVEISDDLEWYFHEDTLTEYDQLENGTAITAQDFIDTYKMALEKEWFRAISGGGDFTTAPQKIVNAQEYADGEVAWEDVGLSLSDDGESIVFEFVGDMGEWNVIYWLSSFVMSPINIELYDLLEADDRTYGTQSDTTAYHGPYYLDYYEPDKVVRFSENPNFHDQDRYNFTAHSYQIIEDDEIRFQEFLNGRLDSVAVPSAQFESYQNDPRIKVIPGATTFRASINSLGTVEAQQEQFPGSDYVPEPILAWEGDEATFRNALYHAWDRQTIADSVQVTNEPAMYYFSDAYLVAPQEGVSFREWDIVEANKRIWEDSETDLEFETWLEDNRDDDASIVGEGLGVDTLGYNPDLSRAIFRDALEDLVDEGAYELGTPDDPLEIEIQFTIQSGSSAQTAYAEFMKGQFEEIFDYRNDDGETLAYMTLDIDPVEFPDNYYTRILVGATDIGMGGIAGSTLDAASFLDVFADDNRGYFTMDWGIDTSTANIEVTYVNATGQEVTQLWSYNALAAALNGTVRIENGEEIE